MLPLIFNIITTNKNKTAIAPTYTIKKIRAKNSVPKLSKISVLKQNTNIKYNTEYIALDVIITKKEEILEQNINKVINILFKDIYI